MGFSLIYVCFVTHILSLNPWTFFILIGCCTYYDNLSLQKKTSPKGLALFICLDIFRDEFQQLLSSHIQSFTIFTTESQMRIDLTSKDTIFF